MQVVSVNDIKTEIYFKRASKPSSKPLIVVVPGNPGVIGFYQTFIDTLYLRLDQQFSIVGVGHAGHGAKGENGKNVFGLQEQVDHKVNFLETCPNLELFQNSDNQPVSNFILIGHSIGAYICVKVKKRKNESVVHVVNLFPTFKKLWDGLAFPVRVLVQPMIRQGFATLLHYSPTSVTNFLLYMSGRLTDEAKYVISSSLDYHLVLNMLHMAWTETKEVDELDDEEILHIFNNHQSHLSFIYGTSDPYTPLHFYEEMKQQLPEAEVQTAEEGVAHAFVLNHSESVAHQVHSLLLKKFSDW
eukprot:TRINITY_DN4389_c0_g1_i1.p1 TRINITY_DN4389_c0_g1~~TRINITY_DN4389_c0_g1_i1.p1  ORF type:complete len:322 (-),score=77.59 TRINITY_DN4389_c0_g1_i1:176-1075(-)